MTKPTDPREAEDKARKKPGGQQHPNAPKKPGTADRQFRAIPRSCIGWRSATLRCIEPNGDKPG